MTLQVLILLSVFTVQCGGCDLEYVGVKNIKTTIESNPTGFRTVFPKDYYVEQRYKNTMLCADPCCVFPAAVVLRDSWQTLLTNLWDEHLNQTLIVEITKTLDIILNKNKYTERFLEEEDLSRLPIIASSPEDLLKQTSELFVRWVEVGCSPSIQTCSLPSLAQYVIQKEVKPSLRARLLTTRAVSKVEEVMNEKMQDIIELRLNSAPRSIAYYASVWSTLLFGLHLWMLL